MVHSGGGGGGYCAVKAGSSVAISHPDFAPRLCDSPIPGLSISPIRQIHTILGAKCSDLTACPKTRPRGQLSRGGETTIKLPDHDPNTGLSRVYGVNTNIHRPRSSGRWHGFLAATQPPGHHLLAWEQKVPYASNVCIFYYLKTTRLVRHSSLRLISFLCLWLLLLLLLVTLPFVSNTRSTKNEEQVGILFPCGLAWLWRGARCV